VSEVELRLRLTLGDVSESKFDVGDLLRGGLISGHLQLDLINVHSHDSPAWAGKAREVKGNVASPTASV
jgi:hypothetical protein